ncbi:type II toxin-antitoxin system HipA family toxin YjjJ [soil metagenome]
MPSADNAFEATLLGALASRGPSTSVELQQITGKSQPTLSRALAMLAGRVVALGRGKATRYAVAQSIHGSAAQQPLWWTDSLGVTERWGTLTFLAGDALHVAAPGIDVTTRGELPWFLTPLRLQGFLGREWARRLALEGDPERWSLAQILLAALAIDDPTGAISLGEPTGAVVPAQPLDPTERAARYDGLAADVITTLPAGSSAGGEQSKFLTALSSGERVLVKFTPPRGTPFGERWHDLLHAEALALQVLGEHGVSVAQARILQSGTRTYLESVRFDRIGAKGLGRRHVVSLDAVHARFVQGSRQNWAATCDALAAQRRLAPMEARAVRALFEFGHMIGNTDMHFGNLSLWADDPATGRFALAPLYDMLPMRWRPDGYQGLQDYTPFEPSRGRLATADGGTSPLTVAREFWQRAAGHAPFSKAFRAISAEMAKRLSA